MTDTQFAIRAYIRDFRETHPYGPSQEEIAAAVGISQQAVQKQLTAMQVAGWVRHDVSVARSVVAIQLAEVEMSGML
jgi:DNA-binding IclR family transcriptional regulator